LEAAKADSAILGLAGCSMFHDHDQIVPASYFPQAFHFVYLGLEVIEVGDDVDDRLFVRGSQLTRRWVAGLNGFGGEGCLDGQERVL